MKLDDALERYRGRKLTEQDISTYQKWTFGYFHDEKHVANPYLSMTLEFDIGDAKRVYDAGFQASQGASFQAYLLWNLAKALREEWVFSTREIDGEWYRFDNLPVCFPVAVGGDIRFHDIMLDDVVLMDWPEFALGYRDAIDNSRNAGDSMDPLTWSLSHFIGNLPDLNFSAFQIHRGALKSGRPVFYFGQRQRQGERYTVPLSISMDHANADPYVLNKMLAVYQRLLSGKSARND